MKIIGGVLVFALLMSPVVAGVGTAAAQATSQRREDMEQFLMDLHEGVRHGNLTDAQKTQLKTDLHNLREAKQNHDRLQGFRAMRSFNQLLDSGAFRPQDAAKIKQDLQKIREAHQDAG